VFEGQGIGWQQPEWYREAGDQNQNRHNECGECAAAGEQAPDNRLMRTRHD
jgi:hypothetical protein